MTTHTRFRGAVWLYAVALIAVTVAVYARTHSFEFLHHDDPLYVTDNPHVLTGLRWENIQWAFTTGHAANWSPVTWLSHMIDVSLFDDRPGGPHVVSFLIHIANTLLVFGLFRRMTGADGRSAFVAALFAVHPLHVESVAWVSERKEVLSTFFGLLAVWMYVSYVDRKSIARYLALCVLFALSLMAKPMWVTLPFALMLLDVWPLNRYAPAGKKKNASTPLRLRQAVIEKIPLMALTVLSSVITVIVQSRGGAVAEVENIPVLFRLMNAVNGYTQYLLLTVIPHGLAAFYPHPGASLGIGRVLVGLLLLAVLSAGALRVWRTRPYITVGWLWFLGTLVPVIGIVQVGSQAYADRYMYMPIIGLFVVAAWGGVEIAHRLKLPDRAVGVVAGVVVLAYAAGAWIQVGYWRDDETLWRRALAVTEGNYRAHANLGHTLKRNGAHEEALVQFQSALALYPNNPRSYVGLGDVLQDMGRPQEALAAYDMALRIEPGHTAAYANMGVLYLELRQADRAVEVLEMATRMDPLNAVAHNVLGAAYATRKEWDRARHHFTEALRLRPGYESALRNLEMMEEAERQYGSG